MTTLVAPRQSDVLTVAEEVWESFLGNLEPAGVRLPETTPVVTAAVTVSGAWNGTVTLELEPAVADRAAAQMLGLSAVSPDDVVDAVGELVNMIGGNIKSLMAGPSTLSLPVVTRGRVPVAAEARDVCRAEFGWAGSPITVTVHTLSTTP